jgi:flagellar motor switch protein FliM
MNTVNYPVYDFVTASKVERPLAAALKAWFTKFSARFRERWSEFSASPVRVTSSLANAMSFDAARTKWTRPTVATPIVIGGKEKTPEVQGLILAHCSDVILLIMEILSESIGERPADRELTSIEVSMCDMLFQTAGSVLGEAWLDKDPLPVKTGAFDFMPNNSRLFAPTKEVIVTGFEVHTSSAPQTGDAKVTLVFGKDELMKLLGVKPRDTQPSTPAKINPELISQIKVELDACLGSAELSMASLLQLAPGAIIRFDQRVQNPLVLRLNGVPKMTGWPGHNDDKSCVMIETSF